MGHRSNTASDWEAGRRFPTALDFFRGCAKSGVDVSRALTHFHRATADLYDADDAWLAAWLRAHKGSTSALALAKRAGLSRHQIHRWIHDQARPRLPHFLMLVQALTGRVSDLVAELVPIDRVAALLPEHHARRRAGRLAFDLPWVPVVLALLETEAAGAHPAHDAAWISACLRIEPAIAERTIAGLLHAGLVERVGTQLIVRQALTIDPRSSRRDMLGLQQGWARIAADRLAEPRPDDVFSFNIFAASSSDMQRIRDLQRAYFRELRSIVATSEPSERLALVVVHLVDLSPGAE